MSDCENGISVFRWVFWQCYHSHWNSRKVLQKKDCCWKSWKGHGKWALITKLLKLKMSWEMPWRSQGIWPHGCHSLPVYCTILKIKTEPIGPCGMWFGVMVLKWGGVNVWGLESNWSGSAWKLVRDPKGRGSSSQGPAGTGSKGPVPVRKTDTTNDVKDVNMELYSSRMWTSRPLWPTCS